MMTQQATVEAVHGKNAVISVRRRSACSSDCDSCKGCAHPEETIRVTAINRAGAMPGDRVTVESDSRLILGLATMLYLMPLVIMVIGYAIGSNLSSSKGEGVSIAFSFAGLLGGLILCGFFTRLLKGKGRMNFVITEILNQS